MQAKIFKRERERLLIDEKSLATSKGLMLGVGARVPLQRPQEETTDLRMLQIDEDHVDGQVREL